MIPFVSRSRARIPALLLAVFALAAVSLPAQAQRAFSLRYSATTSGNIVGIGNVNLHCDPTLGDATTRANCVASRTNTSPGGPGAGSQNNNSFDMRYINGAGGSLNSSSADLNLPAGSTVLFAGLYWAGSNAGTLAQRHGARIRMPGGAYVAVPSPASDTANNAYQGFSNVTALVQAAGSGTYSVADIHAAQGTNQWAGWTLVVAYSNPSQSVRNLAIFDGWQVASSAAAPINQTLTGFITPPSGAVNTTIGVLAWDGDRASTDGGTGLRFGPNAASLSDVSNAANTANNFWNSTISVNGNHVTTGRAPAYTNTLGMDLDFQQPNVPLGNGVSSAVVSVRGDSGDVVWTGMVSLATDVYAPDLVSSIGKEVVDVNGGKVEPGDVLTYTIHFNNSGQDGATNVRLTDPLPAGTTYVPGSLRVLTNDTNDGGATNGGVIGAMTDAADGDVAEFTGSGVVFRLGVNDSAWDGGTGLSNGGMISAGRAGSFSFQVTVNADVTAATTINNVVSVTHNAQTIPGFNAQGQASVPITMTDDADLSIAKTVTPATAVVDDTVTYVLEVGNPGLVAVGNAIVRDPVVPGLDCSAAVPACSATGSAQCPASPTIAGLQGAGLTIPLLPVGDTVRIEFACTVTATP